MKSLRYIILSSILIWSCATNSAEKAIRQKEGVEPARSIHYDKKIEKNKDDKSNIKKEFKSKKKANAKSMNKMPEEVHKNRKKIVNNQHDTQKNLDEISRQKVQQFFDIYGIIKQNRQDEDLQSYGRKQAGHLWADSLKANAGIQSLLAKSYDSIRVQSMWLKEITEATPEISIGTYQMDILAYKGTSGKLLHKTVRIYFANEDLMLEDQVIHTIKTKILELK